MKNVGGGGGGGKTLVKKGPVPSRKRLGGATLVERTCGQNPQVYVLSFSITPFEVAEGSAGMVPVAELDLGCAYAFSAAREARAASGGGGCRALSLSEDFRV